MMKNAGKQQLFVDCMSKARWRLAVDVLFVLTNSLRRQQVYSKSV
jgi:hypothetical protein